MKLFLVIGTGLCLATGIANADTTEVNSDNASEFNSKISFGAMEERVQLDSESAWYIVPNGGINMIDDRTELGQKITFDTGYSLGIGVGFEASENFRIQFDIGYMDNDVDPFSFDDDVAGQVNVTGSIEQLPLMASAIFDIGNSNSLRPYIGFGIGSTRVKHAIRYTATGFEDQNVSDSDWGFTYQISAGLLYEMSPTSDLSVGYRYLNVKSESDNWENHTISLGLNFHF